jgi:hypothetical protein
MTGTRPITDPAAASMTTSRTPGDVQHLDAMAPRHIELDEALQRQRVMVVGDIHGLLCACTHACTHAPMHPCTQNMHACMHVCMCACVHACKRTECTPRCGP